MTGASTGATMEIADALLAAESFEDSCPICGEEMFDSMEYGLMGYNISFCDNCDLDMHTCKGSCKCSDNEGTNTIPIGNVFCDCGFGQVHGSRTPCESCEPISEKIENHNTKMNAAETFEADDDWVKSTASERISGYPSFLRKKLFHFEKQFTMPPHPNTLKIDVDGYFTGISYEDADESYFNTPEFIDERKEFVEIYTDERLHKILEDYTMSKVKNYYEEIEWAEDDEDISYCDDYFKEQMNDYMSDWSNSWMGEYNIDLMTIIHPTFLPTHIKFVDETRGITLYEYNNKGKSIESYDAEGVHPCGCGFGPEGYEGDIESYPCDNYPDCAEGRRYQQLQEELRQMRRLADEKRQYRQTLKEIMLSTQSKGEFEWAIEELKKLNENRAESFEAPRGWGGRMSQKRRWNDNHVVWASDSKLVRQALKEQFPDYKFGVSIIDGQYIQVVVKSGNRPANLDLFREEVETAAMKPIEEAYEDLPEELGDKSVYVMFYDSDFNAESFNVEFDDWADQEMKTHGDNISFKKWAKEEGKKHGDVPITDWAEHEEESHDERYGAEEDDEVYNQLKDGYINADLHRSMRDDGYSEDDDDDDEVHELGYISDDDSPKITLEAAIQYALDEGDITEAQAQKLFHDSEISFWADQEMKTHGDNISFKKWAKEEGKKHGDVPITDWAEHEEESHDERYGAEEFLRNGVLQYYGKTIKEGQEGMFKGGEIKIIKIYKWMGVGRESSPTIVIYEYLDEEGNPLEVEGRFGMNTRDSTTIKDFMINFTPFEPVNPIEYGAEEEEPTMQSVNAVLLNERNPLYDMFNEEQMWLDYVSDEYIAIISNWPHPDITPEMAQALNTYLTPHILNPRRDAPLEIHLPAGQLKNTWKDLRLKPLNLNRHKRR